MKKKQLINEIMGVPKAINPWVSSFYQMIMEVIEDGENRGWDFEGELTYEDPNTKEKFTDVAKKLDTFHIDGKDTMDYISHVNGYNGMEDFIKSEMFMGLPLWRPTVTINIIGIPSVVYHLEKSSPMSASIGTKLTQTLSKIGKTTVFPNVDFSFEIVYPHDGGDMTKFNSDLKSTISHELLHAYQKLKQMMSGGAGHFGKEGQLNQLAHLPNLSKIDLEPWQNFLHLIYLHLSFEINARVTELYHKFKEKGINTKDEFLKELKEDSIWKQMNLLKNFNAEEFIKEFKIPSAKLDYDRNKSPFELLHILIGGGKKGELKRMGVNVSSEKKMLQSIINLWDMILTIGNEQIKNDTGIDFNMMPVPESAKKDPYLFFKFFEKRFHKKAEKWERKLYRIASLLTQNQEDALQ